MSKTFIDGGICQELELEVLAAKEMLDRVICSSEQFSFQICLESGDGSGTFRNWRQTIVCQSSSFEVDPGTDWEPVKPIVEAMKRIILCQFLLLFLYRMLILVLLMDGV